MDTQSDTKSGKQSVKDKGDQSQETEKKPQQLTKQLQFTKKSSKVKTDDLETLKKQLSDKNEELSKMKTELQSTKYTLTETDNKLKTKDKDLQETKKKLEPLSKQLEGTRSSHQSTRKYLEKKTDELETLQKQLTGKNKELSKTKTELQSTKDTLTETENNLKTMVEDLQETNKELEQRTKQLHDTGSALQSTKKSLKEQTEELETLKKRISDKNEELSKTKADLQSKKDTLTETYNTLKTKVKDLQETKTKLEERNELFWKQATVMTECNSTWKREGVKREQAEKEADELRTANEAANGHIQELHRERALLFWRHAVRLIYERQLKTKLRGVICAQTEELRTQLNIITREHLADRNSLRDEIERLKHEHDAARGEWQTQEATLRDLIEELEVKKAELEDQVTHCEMQVKEREGSVQIAKAWVQKLSEQCGANEMIREELNQTKTALDRKDTLYQDTFDQLQREQRDAVQLQANLDREKQLRAAVTNAAQQEANYVRRDQERIVIIKEENEKLEKALRAAYQCNEKQCEELKKNTPERKKLVAELLTLRRQLTHMTENKERLQVKCNHLECELAQSPQHSTPNNTNSGHGLDSDTSLDPSVYGLDQLSPVHHSPDFWKR